MLQNDRDPWFFQHMRWDVSPLFAENGMVFCWDPRRLGFVLMSIFYRFNLMGFITMAVTTSEGRICLGHFFLLHLTCKSKKIKWIQCFCCMFKVMFAFSTMGFITMGFITMVHHQLGENMKEYVLSFPTTEESLKISQCLVWMGTVDWKFIPFFLCFYGGQPRPFRCTLHEIWSAMCVGVPKKKTLCGFKKKRGPRVVVKRSSWDFLDERVEVVKMSCD